MSQGTALETATVLRFDEIDWDSVKGDVDPQSGASGELIRVAAKRGARRKRIARGQGGFFMNRSQMPAGFRVPPHSHDHAELLVVLRGGLSFDGGTVLGPDDAIVIQAGTIYGFSCGPEGLDFLTFRLGEAKVAMRE